MSEEVTHEFKSTQLGRSLKVELAVKVLTTGNWPMEGPSKGEKDLNVSST